MTKPMDVQIAVTSPGRSPIAASFVAPFFFQVQGSAVSTVRLVIGKSDSNIAGLGAPIVVNKKKYHFNFSNPAGLARMALLGRGFYKEKIPLRAIGVFPSWDRLVFAVKKETGIRSIDEIKEKKYPLRVSTRSGGKLHGTLFAINEVLKEYGFRLADIERWGGKVLRARSPSSPDRMEHINKGAANAVFDEGIKSWGSIALNSGMRFLPIHDVVLKRIEKLGFSRAQVTPMNYPELDHPVMTLDFSGWLLFCLGELPSPIAYGMAQAIDLVHQQIPVDHFDRKRMTIIEFCQGGEGGSLTIPLHPGAKKYFRQKDYI